LTQQRNLYISSFAPTLGSGRALRTYTCIRALAMLGPLDLIYVPHGGEPSPEYQAIEGLELHEVEGSRGLGRAAVYASKRLQGVPSTCCVGTSPELIQKAEDLAQMPGRGRVIVGDLNSATALMPLARRRPIIYNAHNIESERVAARRGAHGWAQMRMRAYDVETAQAMVPGARLRYVPNVVDVTAVRPRRADGAAGSRLLMIGDFTYPPNRSGRDFLIEHVLPRVWQSVHEAQLTLVGRGLEAWEAPDERVHVAGFVPDLGRVYEETDCVVVPLTEGKGTPLKFIEALAYGVPIVATPLAARGLDVEADVHFREGCSAETFADAIVDVLRNGAREMAIAARQLAEREYSIETLAERIAA
jgi:polysaccharide biosynthesis protein PslH